ncbi:MAG TPA: tRNA preQ1(34) S-adenosylmethionine ribosyltransferase-isomerase QueA [Myxococcota bacterium]|nr:tRNA preQ1(34) S-adenosylmethionine ribosyltransferase-isomerase QueA [Myxococcota bacterium]HRY92461.1 tRNA preQ1(34) S-adenosylmethionine ribosyltransferase-isomerase QueA [Myxococcota bacterium]HSA23970.1 tRNA preQ1(34) S-adenosylmethionine ribosyltransferase-isomerase QueA [Myxococcota bacterium]
MRIDDFDYELPEVLIAQRPAEARSQSRLLCLPPDGGPCRHHRFAELPGLLRPGDLLVLNDTRVLPARLIGRKASGGRVELLLDRPLEAPREAGGRVLQRWICLAQSSKPWRAGTSAELPGGARARSAGPSPEGGLLVELDLPGPLEGYLAAHGQVPLPAYIRRDGGDPALAALDRERYQTVFAREGGAVAAPTAGLHFDPPLLAALEAAGVQRAALTLHVGPGTFLPVRVAELERHRMHAERYRVPSETVEAVARARREGRRVVAVGTTVVRALESAWGLAAGEGLTALFIRPGHRFQAVDAMITNFHLPRSTLLVLVSAFAGRERVLAAYREAVAQGYRFYSYGDAMLIG